MKSIEKRLKGLNRVLKEDLELSHENLLATAGVVMKVLAGTAKRYLRNTHPRDSHSHYVDLYSARDGLNCNNLRIDRSENTRSQSNHRLQLQIRAR